MQDDAFEWDPQKRLRNLEKHGLDFADAGMFDWAAAVTGVDGRRDYGEKRETAVGLLAGQRVKITFTMRGRRRRIISMHRVT